MHDARHYCSHLHIAVHQLRREAVQMRQRGADAARHAHAVLPGQRRAGGALLRLLVVAPPAPAAGLRSRFGAVLSPREVQRASAGEASRS